MKKIFSTLLILCMVLTSLSVGVSASYTAPTEDANYNTFTFDGTTGKGYSVGEFYLENADKSEHEKLGTITDDVTNMGMNFKEFVFDAGSLSGATASTLSIRGEVYNKEDYYNNFTYKQGHCGNECFYVTQMNTILKANDLDGDGVVDKDSSNIVKYTMYAYSALPDGEPISFNIVRGNKDYGAVLTVPASKLYSENSIPHKIDFIFYFNNTYENPMSTASSTSQRMELWIDGLPYTEGYARVEALSDKLDTTMVFMSPNVNFTPDENGNVKWKDTKLYIWTYKARSNGKPLALSNTEVGGTYLTIYTRDALHSNFFQDVKYGSGNYNDTHKGFVTGVYSALTDSIEDVYTTALTSGDRVIEVDASVYNNPASIWNDGATESSVSLVKIEDGTVYGVADKANVTESFDKYLISVNGVYTKVELAPVSYDIDAKTATVNVEKLPAGTENLQVVVAAYNSNDTMKAIKVSSSYNDLSSNVIYTVDGDFPTNASKYKIFVFDSLTSAKPLLEALEK